MLTSKIGDDVEWDENDDNNNNCPHKDQIFVHTIHAKDAAGPTFLQVYHVQFIAAADLLAI